MLSWFWFIGFIYFGLLFIYSVVLVLVYCHPALNGDMCPSMWSLDCATTITRKWGGITIFLEEGLCY